MIDMIKDYSIVEDENGIGKCLVLHTAWDRQFLKLFNSDQVNGIRLSYSVGWRCSSLEFLDDLPSDKLRSIYIDSHLVKNLVHISRFHSLQSLGVHCSPLEGLELHEFTNLTHLYLGHSGRKKDFSYSSLSTTLVYLNITNYPLENLESIHHLSNLESLHISSRKLTSLTGLEKLDKLQKLDLFQTPNLLDFEPLRQLTSLRCVAFNNVKGFNDLLLLNGSKELLEINLENCAPIKSLRPIEDFSQLTRLFLIGRTVVEDGDLTPILNHPSLTSVALANKKHYHPNARVVMETIDRRTG